MLALADALAQRRKLLGEDEWWLRYGAVWAAIQADILPRFTPAQVEQARMQQPDDALLDLVEEPWEQP
ncbi:hypothetical protein A5722_32290 [Mycobacterium vulneris]|nr:hypothetical protein A5722_32290 [Mycolicibacterium vulneris]OCB67832.1 hypothetical protein A5729_06815 [Mycolicibacterium vulneris]